MLITVSRQTGSLGKEITDLLANMLNVPIITRDMVMTQWFPEIATKHELHMLTESPGFFLTTSAQGITFAKHLENKLKEYTADHPAIVFGLGAQVIFADNPQALHIKIIASPEVRTRRIMQTHSLEQTDAQRFLELTDRKHKRYISTIYDTDWSNPELYHLTLNTDFLSVEEGASLIYFLSQNRHITRESGVVEEQEPQSRAVIFKHQSEEEFAKILDMHEIEWEYEPRTFPIKWDTEGHVTQAFSPDFYLPRFNSYIELTTMDQRYVAEKKKKVALLRKLYPGTNISIVFKNDFYSLIKRFGIREESE